LTKIDITITNLGNCIRVYCAFIDSEIASRSDLTRDNVLEIDHINAFFGRRGKKPSKEDIDACKNFQIHKFSHMKRTIRRQVKHYIKGQPPGVTRRKNETSKRR